MDVFCRVSPRDLDMDDTRALSQTALAENVNAPEAASVDPSGVPAADVPAVMADLARRAKQAARRVALAAAGEKDAALRAMAAAVRARASAIVAANEQDLAEARAEVQVAAFSD